MGSRSKAWAGTESVGKTAKGAWTVPSGMNGLGLSGAVAVRSAQWQSADPGFGVGACCVGGVV